MFGDRKGIRALLFHTVFLDEKETLIPHILPQQKLTLDKFRWIFEYFLEKDYRFLGYPDISKKLNPDEKYVYVTFDDGYYNNSRIISLIEELRIPIHIFVTTRNCLSNTKFWWDVVYSYRQVGGVQKPTIDSELDRLKQLNIDEIESYLRSEFGEQAFNPLSDLDRPFSRTELSELTKHELVTIGNHTHTHAIATNLKADELREEVVKCSEEIEKATNREPSGFAFPNGNYRVEDLVLLGSLGIDLAFSCEWKNNKIPSNAGGKAPYFMGRYCFSGNTDLNWQAEMIRAGGSPYFQIQQLRSGLSH